MTRVFYFDAIEVPLRLMEFEGTKKVLFIASHRPNRSPSQRFRFEQYFNFLNENGIESELSFIINEEDDKYLYKRGFFLRKLNILIRSILIRKSNLKNLKKFDVIFIQREALMVGSAYFEKKIKKFGIPIIYDFDDSIWILDTSEGNKKLEWLKKPDKTKEIISLSDLIIAGNKYLSEYALQFNKNVIIIPTTVDTVKFYPNHLMRNMDKIVIGWSGSITTIKHFNFLLPVLKKLKEKYGEKIIFRVIGDDSYINNELGIRGEKWNSETEVEVLNSFDIGIMPLPNDKWAKGKCGLKGLTYMALEIPTIMSPVGVNAEIINNGVNGFLADDEHDWFNLICTLIENKALREKIGKEARKTVEDKYSVNANKEKYLNAIRGILASRKKN